MCLESGNGADFCNLTFHIHLFALHSSALKVGCYRCIFSHFAIYAIIEFFILIVPPSLFCAGCEFNQLKKVGKK